MAVDDDNDEPLWRNFYKEYYVIPFNTFNVWYKDNKYRVKYYRARLYFKTIYIFNIYLSFD